VLSSPLNIYVGDISITTPQTQFTNCQGKTEKFNISTSPSILPFGTTIQWSPADGLSNTNILNPQVVIGEIPITYTVAVTLPNGCTATASITAYPSPCCPSQLGAQEYFGSPNNPFDLSTLPPQALVSKTTPIILNGHFTINAQNLNTNNTVSFANCSNVLLSPGATITVPDGKKLVINNSHLKACDNQLWQGIVLPTPTSEIEVVNGSIIEQAEIAVRSQNGAKLSIEGCTFDNNYVSVQIENGGDFYNGTIQYSKFLCSANSLLLPRAGQKPTSGVQLLNTNGMTIGLSSNQPQDYNEFDNLNNGINALNSSVTVYANKFSNIKVWDTPNNPHHGAGVYARGWGRLICLPFPFNICYPVTSAYSVTVRTTLNKPKQSTSPTFENCDRGIDLFNVHTNVLFNPMLNLKDAVLVRNGINKSIQVYSNKIENVERGISILANSMGEAMAHNNVIKVNEPPVFTYPNIPNFWNQYVLNEPAESFRNSYGIFAIMDKRFSSKLRVYADSIEGGRYSIKLENCDGDFSAFNNVLKLTDTKPNRGEYAGIHLQNSIGGKIYENRIYGNSTEHILPFVDWNGVRYFINVFAHESRKSGIVLNKSTDYLLSCNAMGNIGYGLLALGSNKTEDIDKQNLQSGIRNNTFGHSKFGLVLQESLGSFGFIGKSVGTLNKVNNNYFNAIYNNPGNGSQPYQTFNYTSDLPAALSYVPRFIYRPNQSQTPFPNGNNTTNFQLNAFTQIANSTTGYANCLAGIGGGVSGGVGAGRSVELAEMVAAGYVQFTQFDEVNRWMEKRQLFRELTNDSSLRFESEVLEDFYEEEKQENIGKLHEVDGKLSLAAKALEEELFNEFGEKIFQAKAMNNALVSDKIYEQNEQFVNKVSVFLLENEIEDLPEQDWQHIAELAIACPLVEGTAVYSARALLSLRRHDLFFDDELLCSEQGYFKNIPDISELLKHESNAQLPQFARLHYIEAEEAAEISYLLQENVAADLHITDAAGRLITVAQLLPNLNSRYVSLNGLAKGTYIYSIRAKNDFFTTGKFLVL
jgi:hypothetical protein